MDSNGHNQIPSNRKSSRIRDFTRAAELLNCTQSAVSKMVQDLKQEWGLCLLKRSRQGVSLTTEGQTLFPTIQRICNEQHQLETQIGALHEFETGSIRIGTISSIATHLLPPLLSSFNAEYPNIRFELLLGEYGEISEWIEQGRVDFGFLRLPVDRPFEIKPILTDPLLVVLPPNHPLSVYQNIPPKELENYPFILLSRTYSAEVPDLVKDQGLTLDVRYRTWDDYAVMVMVEQGLGISILPNLMLKRCSYAITSRPLEGGAFRTLVLARRKATPPSLAVERFLSFLE